MWLKATTPHVRDALAKPSLIDGSLRQWASEDLDGWQRVPELEPRSPMRRRRRDRLSGPWVVGEQTAHGLYEREAEAGRECAAAYDGWMLWRWCAPRMEWCHPLTSAWNAILANDLVTLHWRRTLQWPQAFDAWTADAVLAGWMPAAHVELGATDRIRSPRQLRRWVDDATARGLVVVGDADTAVATRRDLLGGAFPLNDLVTAYAKVLPGELSTRVAVDLFEHGAEWLPDLAVRGDDLPLVVRALVAGYPPDIVAGMLLAGNHHDDDHGGYPEQGLYCPRCSRWPQEREWSRS
jgi:hypothetical protein